MNYFRVDPESLKLLGKKLEYIGKEAISEMEQEVAQLAKVLYARAVDLVKSKLKGTADEYIAGLDLKEERTGSRLEYTLSLSGPGEKWEEGFESFDMKPNLINGPNSKQGANGTRYNTVPFTHHPYSSGAGYSASVQKLQQSAKKALAMYGLDKVISSSNNVVLLGKVGVINDKRFDANIQGLTKFQTPKKIGTQSTFMTFRRVSTNSPSSSWIHPGFAGIDIWPDLEQYAEGEMNELIKQFGLD